MEPINKITIISTIINRLSIKHNQTPDVKISINNSLRKSGHGAIFLGTSSSMRGGLNNIRILVGIDKKREISTFGGKSNDNEPVIQTMIREIIEEVFNIRPKREVVEILHNYFNRHTDLYYIYYYKQKAYTYLFDVSILGVFIYFISSVPLQYRKIKGTYTFDINTFFSNELFLDTSSVDASRINKSITSNQFSIKLDSFMFNREIVRRTRMHGLDEMQYLSFPSLYKILRQVIGNRKIPQPVATYDIFMVSQKYRNGPYRERLHYNRLFYNILDSSLIIDILKIICAK